MCDCGCGGSSSGCGGNCGGDCGQPTKIITVEKQGSSASTFYKGDDFTCAVDSSIDVANGEGLNPILQKMLTKLCLLDNGGNYTFAQPDRLVISNAESPFEEDNLLGADVVKLGEALRVTIGVQFLSVTDPGGIPINVSYIAKNPVGTVTSVSLGNIVIPQLTIANSLTIEAVATLHTNASLGVLFKSVGNTASLNYVSSIETGLPNISVYNEVGIRVAATVNGSDQLIFNVIELEHLR